MKKELVKASIFVVLALLFFLLLTWGQDVIFNRFGLFYDSYTTIFKIVELMVAFLALNIFMNGMFYYQYASSTRIAVFSSAFLGIAVFGMLQLLVPTEVMNFSSKQLATITDWFQLLEGITLSLFFLFFIFLGDRKQSNVEFKQVIMAIAVLIPIVATVLIFSMSETLPSLSSSKAAVSIIIIFIHSIILGRAIFLLKKEASIEVFFVMCAAFFLLFASISLAFEDSMQLVSQFETQLLKLIGYLYIFRAILNTVAKVPYEQVQELSSRHSMLLNNVVEGIYGVDLDGRVTFINESGSKMLGYREDELVGRHIHPLVHHTKKDGTDYPNDQCPISSSTRDGQSRTITDEVFWRKDGSSFPVEYFTRPLSENENITGTVVTFMNITEKVELETLQEEQRNLEYEVELAATLQKELLSASNTLPDFVDVGVVSIPYKLLNGDFYAFSPFEKSLSVAIADVCGKGIPAAFQMAMMKFAMEMNRPPNEIMGEINQFFSKHMGDSSFITMFIANYDHSNRQLTYTSAGHEPAILYRQRENEFLELTTRDPLLGIQRNVSYKSETVTMEKGDLLLLYTDGMIERRRNKEDSNDILKKIIQDIDSTLPAQQVVNELYKKVDHYYQQKVEDDQTLIVVKIV